MLTSWEAADEDVPTAPNYYSAGGTLTNTSCSARSTQHTIPCTRRYTMLRNADPSLLEKSSPACSTKRVSRIALYLKKIYCQELIAEITATGMFALCCIPERVTRKTVKSPNWSIFVAMRMQRQEH